MWSLLSCAAPERPPLRLEPETPRVADAAWVRYRPGEPASALGPLARVDLGLRAAAEELVAGASSPRSRVTAAAARLATARAGYPGDARFLSVVSGRAPPAALLDAVPRDVPIDVGWASRQLGAEEGVAAPQGGSPPAGGGAGGLPPAGAEAGAWLHLVGWAPRRATLSPVRRDLALDEGLSLRVGGLVDPRLFVAGPAGRVTELRLPPDVARWVDTFHEPGEHRIEVVEGERVELLFSVFVDTPPPAAPRLLDAGPPPDPEAATAWGWEALAELRRRAGVGALQRFPDFDAYTRVHATCLAGLGVLTHASPSCPRVRELVARAYRPRAEHRQDLAVGATVEDAWDKLVHSPAHLLNLQCPTCTHASLGAALEPAAGPRVFLAVELLAFPEGPPRRVAP